MEEKFRIVLCIKPVKSELVTQEKTTDQDAFQMNPFDLRALEVLADKRKHKMILFSHVYVWEIRKQRVC